MTLGSMILAVSLLSQTPAASPQAVSQQQSFLNWLNATRAQYRLPAVGYDANLEAWAQQNNVQQQWRGMGHFVMGPARRQNSAWSPGGFGPIPNMWMWSPGHRAALLDPTIRYVGLAGLGAYWTFDAY